MANDHNLEKYSRQIILNEIGHEGQEKIKRVSILVIGAGGLGSSVIKYLSAAGVGKIGIVDDDKVELSNLNRQLIYIFRPIMPFYSRAYTCVLNYI